MKTLLRCCAVAALLAAAAVAAQTPDTVRPAVAKPVKAALDLVGAGQHREALAKVAEAEAVPDRTPYENFILDQVRGSAAAGAGDLELAQRSYEAALASGRLQPADAQRIAESMTAAAYQAKDFARAAAWGQRYIKEGGSGLPARQMLVNALYQRADWAGASQQLQTLIGEDEAAGRRPGEELLRLLASSQTRLNDAAGYRQTLERLLRFHPKPAYWRDRVSQLAAQPGFDDALTLDAHRLLQASGAQTDAGDYLALAELALRAGLPAEAQRAMEAGYAAGKLGSGADAAKQQALRERAARDAATDAKEFDRNAPPPSTASANARVNQGLALVTAGRAERGIPLVEQGLAQSGLARPEIARLRLGWAQAQAGRGDAAKATFRALQDNANPGVAELARLWLIQLERPATP